ncbi:hypothetical protein KVV02_001693 [Mortierella alpina]|uniref:Uncharacterized protein n=1 Tax=Mortierella alpina TaxID=64518 RepID=A0A9P8A1L6_MORAP|nr:hypothetical protein KVV02_001693 [Mortierella alpina]
MSRRVLLQELSLAPEEGALKELAEGFENLAQTRSNNMARKEKGAAEEYIELYTTKISHIQGWIASHKIHLQSARLLSTPSSLHHHHVEEGVDSEPPSPPTFTQLIPRFIDSYRFALIYTSGSNIPWDKDGLEDEQLLIQFLKRLPGDSLRAFSSNKFSLRNRSLSELLTSSAEHLPGLSCLSMYRNDASVVNSQLMASNWYQEDSPCVDPFTAEIDWFLQRCPVQLQTLRIAIAGFLEPMHERIAEQRRRDTRNKTPQKLARTAIKHLYLEGNLALSSQPEFLERCPNLQSLSLSCSKSSPVLHLAPMIVHCPKIEDLALSSPSRPVDDMTQCVAAFLRACAPSSTSPSFSSPPSKMERTGLKRLRLENLQATQDRILEALQLFGPTLTHLAIRNCRLPMTLRPQSTTERSPSPFSFNRILETFTQLQELDIMCTPKFIHLQPFRPRSVMLHGKFDAQHLVEDLRPLTTRNDAPGGIPHMAWACSQTLKVLRIEISGIHRAPPPCTRLPDTHVYFTNTTINSSSSTSPASFPITTTTTPAAATLWEVAGPDPEQIKEGYRLQREVCLVLGTLSSLEELCLGALNVPGDDRPPALPGLARWRGGFYSTATGIQTQCLELSLSTGLELMCGMKEMRVLKVGGLEHRIGLGEIQWMCEHWPKLEAVYGLLRVKNREQYDPDWEGKEEDDETERETVNWIRKNPKFTHKVNNAFLNDILTFAQHTPRLQVLEFEHFKFTDEYVHQLVHLIKNHPHLRRVRIDCFQRVPLRLYLWLLWSAALHLESFEIVCWPYDNHHNYDANAEAVDHDLRTGIMPPDDDDDAAAAVYDPHRINKPFRIQELDLGQCHIAMTGGGGPTLATLLRHCSRLKSLTLPDISSPLELRELSVVIHEALGDLRHLDARALEGPDRILSELLDSCAGGGIGLRRNHGGQLERCSAMTGAMLQTLLCSCSALERFESMMEHDPRLRDDDRSEPYLSEEDFGPTMEQLPKPKTDPFVTSNTRPPLTRMESNTGVDREQQSEKGKEEEEGVKGSAWACLALQALSIRMAGTQRAILPKVLGDQLCWLSELRHVRLGSTCRSNEEMIWDTGADASIRETFCRLAAMKRITFIELQGYKRQMSEANAALLEKEMQKLAIETILS